MWNTVDDRLAAVTTMALMLVTGSVAGYQLADGQPLDGAGYLFVAAAFAVLSLAFWNAAAES